jgi:hypothetical protein
MRRGRGEEGKRKEASLKKFYWLNPEQVVKLPFSNEVQRLSKFLTNHRANLGVWGGLRPRNCFIKIATCQFVFNTCRSSSVRGPL